MLASDLRSIPLFTDLNDDQLELLIPIIVHQSCQIGTQFFQQDEAARHFYIVKNGEVAVEFKPFDGPPMLVAYILPGGIFGWSAALGHTQYTSSARAITPCEVFRLSGAKLQQLCAKHPDTGVALLGKLCSVISERLMKKQSLILNQRNRQMEDQISGIVKPS